MRAPLAAAFCALAFATLALATPARAQTPASDDACAAFAWPVTDVRQAFAAAIPTVASGAAAPKDFRLTLAPTEGVPFPTKPERAPKKPGTFGGFVTTDPPSGKFLQVTLSGEAWIDVVQAGAAVKSAAFSGKGGCAGVRKSVRFPLTRSGPVTVQISGVETPTIDVDVRGAD